MTPRERFDACRDKGDFADLCADLLVDNAALRLDAERYRDVAERTAYVWNTAIEAAAQQCHNSIQTQGPYFATLVRSLQGKSVEVFDAAMREGK